MCPGGLGCIVRYRVERERECLPDEDEEVVDGVDELEDDPEEVLLRDRDLSWAVLELKELAIVSKYETIEDIELFCLVSREGRRKKVCGLCLLFDTCS